MPTRVAQRIHTELSAPFTLNEHEIFSSTSIGIALSTTAYDSPEDILRDAGIALHRAKRRARLIRRVRPDHARQHRSAYNLRQTCAVPSSGRNSGSITSQLCRWIQDVSLGSRPWCAGSTRSGASFRRQNSFPPPRKRILSPRSAPGYSARPPPNPPLAATVSLPSLVTRQRESLR